MTSGFSPRTIALGALLLTSAVPALAAPCGTGTFEAWLEDFKKEAASKGISQPAIAAGLTGVALDQAILGRDHSQAGLCHSVHPFSCRMVPPRTARASHIPQHDRSGLPR